jgi:hypothetical protein
MNKKYYKVGLLLICFLSIGLYAFSVMYQLKIHQIIKNPVNNKDLHYYISLSRNFMSFYLICIHLITVPVFLLNYYSKIKGLLYINVIGISMSILCLGIKIKLDYGFFKFSSDVLQFFIILISLNILYSLYYLIRGGYRKIKTTNLSS